MSTAPRSHRRHPQPIANLADPGTHACWWHLRHREPPRFLRKLLHHVRRHSAAPELYAPRVIRARVIRARVIRAQACTQIALHEILRKSAPQKQIFAITRYPPRTPHQRNPLRPPPRLHPRPHRDFRSYSSIASSASAARILCQLSSSISGSTRVSASTLM